MAPDGDSCSGARTEEKDERTDIEVLLEQGTSHWEFTNGKNEFVDSYRASAWHRRSNAQEVYIYIYILYTQ